MLHYQSFSLAPPTILPKCFDQLCFNIWKNNSKDRTGGPSLLMFPQEMCFNETTGKAMNFRRTEKEKSYFLVRNPPNITASLSSSFFVEIAKELQSYTRPCLSSAFHDKRGLSCATTKSLEGMLFGRLLVGTGMGLGPSVASLYVTEDSLGGNSKTTIIANISPSMSCSLKTLSTLRFVQHAKFIKNNDQ